MDMTNTDKARRAAAIDALIRDAGMRRYDAVATDDELAAEATRVQESLDTLRLF